MFAVALLAIGSTASAQSRKLTPLQAAERKIEELEAGKWQIDGDIRAERARAATTLAEAKLEAALKLAASEAKLADAKLASEIQIAKIEAAAATKIAETKLAEAERTIAAQAKLVETERQQRLAAEAQVAALQSAADKETEGHAKFTFLSFEAKVRHARNLPPKK